jgi:UDP-4-amino-4,6-dideoxy-N-acetyl-beta-L-altrosamine transaminase
LESDIEAVVEVLRSDFLTQGPVVPRFEQAVATYCGAGNAITLTSATAALHVACLALDLKSGDWLWTSPTTFVASANCARYCGAQVDFVDIDPDTYNMSIQCLEEKLIAAEREGKLPKVVVPVHLCGQPCEMEAIHKLSQKYGFKIIEDAAHAIGGKYLDEPIGSCRYSDITVFSFHPVKIITTGEGGMALTNDEKLAERMRLFRSHGITSNPQLMKPRPAEEIWNYQQIYLGYNYRMTDIQAALGISQLERLDNYVEKRQEIAKKYDELFKEIPLQLPFQHPDSYSSYHLYPIRVKETNKNINQRQVYDDLQSAGINVNLHYIPVYRQPYYEMLGFKSGYCPEAELYHREVVSMPIYPSLTNEQHEFVISTVKTIFET